MDEEELEQKAENFAGNFPIPLSLYEIIEPKKELMKEVIKQVYIACAKENGIVLHDLRKNPNDLPLKMGIGSEVVLISYGGKVTDFAYYNFKLKRWEHDEDDFYICDPPPIAWCEIPEFEEE